MYAYDEDNELDKIYKESIDEKISEYRGNNNEKLHHNDFFCP
jgi:hypothetical protein